MALASLQAGQCLRAATYYVAQSGGSDSYTPAQAASPATPWLTLQHAANNVAAGDTVLIRAGTYRETVTLPVSGTSNAPITFQGYTNEIAVVSGANPVTNWALEGTNIYLYYASMNLTLGDGNQVFQNGQMMPEARWPNAGPAYPWQNTFTNPSPDWAYVATAGYTSGANGWITCTNLPSRADNYWTGARLHCVSGLGWIFQLPNVKGSTNSTKTIYTDENHGNNSSYAFQAGNEFYLSGIKGELDSPGEWWYDTNNFRLYFYSTTSPTNVEAKVRPLGFDLSGRPWIQLKNLSFLGCSIQTDGGSTNHVYDGITMKYVMHTQLPSTTNRLVLQGGSVLRNSDVGFSSGSLVYLAGSNIRVINNNLHDAGYNCADTEALIESARTGQQTNQQNLISHNSIHDEGRYLIFPIGNYGIIEYNDFYNGMRLTSDAGAVAGGLAPTLFQYNLVHDTFGPVGHSGYGVSAIYLDGLHGNWVIHHNAIWNNSSFCLDLNPAFEFDFIFNNTCAYSSGSMTSGFSQTQEAGEAYYNNLFNTPLNFTANWNTTDIRYNLYTYPGFATNTYPGIRTNFVALQANSIAIDKGIIIPGVTDGYIGPAPDLGAFEQGGVDWTPQVGRSAMPPSPDPVYSYPNLVFANKVVDGSFESGGLSNWISAPGGNVTLNSQNAWGSDNGTRSGSYSASFGLGTSQLGQTITNLLPNSRYKFYAGIRSSNTTATIILGVSNYGNPIRETTIPATNGWGFYNLAFVTGSSNTSATIYINVVCSGAAAVFADDLGVILKREPGTGQESPLAYYKFDETSGLTALDASGNGLNATLSNSVTAGWTNGVRNGAFHFNGSDVMLTPPIATPTNGLTVACWAKSDTATWNAWGCLISQGPSFNLGPAMNSKQMRFGITGGGTIYWTPTYDITQWHHYAGVFDPSNQLSSLYVDGLLMGTVTTTGISNCNNQIFIGKDDYNFDTNRWFKGSMDDVRIYGRALSQTEIQTLLVTNSNLLLHLALDDPAGSTNAWDASGTGNNGSLLDPTQAANWTNGILNGALNFDGVDDVVTTPAITTPASLTISCWAKSATTNWNASGCLVAHRPAFVLSPILGTRNLQFILYTNAASYVTVAWIAPSSFDITQWHHYAGVFNPASQQACLYVDGFSVATNAAVAVNPDNGQVFIGQDSAGGANANFNGMIDDVCLYSRALAGNEVLDLAYLTSEPPYYAATPPISPVNFSASAGGSSTIMLGWGAADSTQPGYELKGYELNYRLAGDTVWVNLANLAGNVTSYTSTGLTYGASYDYQIRATNAAGASGFVSATATTIASEAITGALNINGKFTITFLRDRADLAYIVEYSTNLLVGTWSAIATNPGTVGNVVTVVDNSPTNASTRFFRLKVTSP